MACSARGRSAGSVESPIAVHFSTHAGIFSRSGPRPDSRSEEHTSELQSPDHLVSRLLLEKQHTLAPFPTFHAGPFTAQTLLTRHNADHQPLHYTITKFRFPISFDCHTGLHSEPASGRSAS